MQGRKGFLLAQKLTSPAILLWFPIRIFGLSPHWHQQLDISEQARNLTEEDRFLDKIFKTSIDLSASRRRLNFGKGPKRGGSNKEMKMPKFFMLLPLPMGELYQIPCHCLCYCCRQKFHYNFNRKLLQDLYTANPLTRLLIAGLPF